LDKLKYYIKQIFEFIGDDTPYYAASLSFFTIFSLLPILALLIWFVSSLEILQENSDLLLKYILDLINPSHSQRIDSFITKFLQKSDSFGYVGFGYLIFVFTMFFRDYEYIINKIHNVKKRPFYKVLFIYSSLFLIVPILFGVFLYVISFSKSSLFSSLLTFGFLWFLMIVIFDISINRKVSFNALISSSFLTLIALIGTKNLFVQYVLLNKTYTTLYGSLSVILFFFLWIYISWNIYLYGMKICHSINTKEMSLLG
jgi:membrane protein